MSNLGHILKVWLWVHVLTSFLASIIVIAGIISFLASFVVIKLMVIIFTDHDNCLDTVLQLHVGRSHDRLSPGIGIQWYLFMNLFGRCKQFFVVCTKGFPFLFLVPLSIRFYRYPMAMVSLQFTVKNTTSINSLHFFMIDTTVIWIWNGTNYSSQCFKCSIPYWNNHPHSMTWYLDWYFSYLNQGLWWEWASYR